jgi:hypothetical protein
MEATSIGPARRRHELKEWTPGFRELLQGGRRFEIRQELDREWPFTVGDELLIHEYDHRQGQLTGVSALFRITHVVGRLDSDGALSGLLAPGVVVLGLEPVGMATPLQGSGAAADLRALVELEQALGSLQSRLPRLVEIAGGKSTPLALHLAQLGRDIAETAKEAREEAKRLVAEFTSDKGGR